MSRRRQDVVEVLLLLRVQVAEHALAQDLGKADDGVERRPQLVRHAREERRLVLARRLELAVEAIELVAHPVDVPGQGAQLVAVGDVDVPREVARRDRGQLGVDPPDGSDHRPGEHETEQQRERDRRRRDGDEEVPLARVRPRVLGDELVGLAIVGGGELRGDLEEVAREAVGLVPERFLLVVRRTADLALDDLANDRPQPRARRTDVSQEGPMARWAGRTRASLRLSRARGAPARPRPRSRSRLRSFRDPSAARARD